MVTSWTPALGHERQLRLDELTLEDLEAVRLMLRGSSVIDWYQLHFHDENDVDRFLRVNEFDPASPDDIARLEELRLDAVEYLSRNFNMELPDAVANRVPARDLFLMASRDGKQKTWACIILKVMHIAHHLAGRELSTRLPISVDQIYRQIELKVMRVVDELRAAGYPVTEFQWSRKTQDSLITKLLAKRSTLAANIYDKLRFRMIVRTPDDLPSMLVALHRRLIPFNYVVPGASVNHLLPFRQVLDGSNSLRAMEPLLQHDTTLEKQQERAAAAPINEFSGKRYKIVNFVADLPVRVDPFLDAESRTFGNVVFVLTEFQLVDQETALENERGDNSHEEYKARQYRSVRHRLMRGLERRNEQPSEEPVRAPPRAVGPDSRPPPVKLQAARRSPDRRRRPR
ncbi:MAG TPA: TIGR04552 family protein [Kofleriaceae bacterium]|nr:TIGR04552 family protein [Kofleriaceae bacterium]